MSEEDKISYIFLGSIIASFYIIYLFILLIGLILFASITT